MQGVTSSFDFQHSAFDIEKVGRPKTEDVTNVGLMMTDVESRRMVTCQVERSRDQETNNWYQVSRRGRKVGIVNGK